jgi:hypothetical protein
MTDDAQALYMYHYSYFVDINSMCGWLGVRVAALIEVKDYYHLSRKRCTAPRSEASVICLHYMTSAIYSNLLVSLTYGGGDRYLYGETASRSASCNHRSSCLFTVKRMCTSGDIRKRLAKSFFREDSH